MNGDRVRPDYGGMGTRYPDYNRYRPDDRYGPPSPMYPPNRRYPPRYPPPIDNSIGDSGVRYYPENRYPDTRPDMDGRYYPTTVHGTRYPTSDNRFPVGNDRNPIFILKYGNRFGGGSSGKFHFI